MKPTVKEFVELCLAQEGDEYKFGAETSPNDPDPDTFDCSELVEWACARLGVKPIMPDGALFQIRHCRKYAPAISVEEAIKTPGALLFYFAKDPFQYDTFDGRHVAVSQGNGKTIEARGAAYGVGQWSANGRGWTHAGLVPGMDYGAKESDSKAAVKAGDVLRVLSKGLNVRSGPGASYEVWEVLQQGTKILGSGVPVNGWQPIQMDDDTVGYCAGKYLEAV